MVDDVKGSIAHTVLSIYDKDVRSKSPSVQNGINRFWGFRGRLLVIATQFHDGVHYATRPVHFLPIINHLEKLHRQGFVHGDIRAYNMVFKYDVACPESNHFAIDTRRNTTTNNFCDGWLIDFDFGGKYSEEVCYPKGYKRIF